MDEEPPQATGRAGRLNRIVCWIVGILVVLGLLRFATPSFPDHGGSVIATAMSNQAHGIHLALMAYAADHNGEFPTATGSSNDAFRKLIPVYLGTEKPFYFPGSAWHESAPRKRPDEDIGMPPKHVQALQRGENHWAYVSGLTNSSDPNLPIIADGFSNTTAPPNGTYSKNPKKKGGFWKGEKAIVVDVDGVVRMEAVDPNSLCVMRVRGVGRYNIFSVAYGTDPANVKNPDG